ncbi:MAG: hypothetical protein IPP52_09180 [Ignavibacteria bacterium]|nr:hypothetical protein [Ignavibacteria bacterium]
MAKNAAAFLSENEAITSAIPELQNHHTALKAKCDEIETKDTERITIRKGKYLNKVSEKSEANKQGARNKRSGICLCKESKNVELAERSLIFRSDLQNMRDTELAAKLRFIKELAEENLQSLEPLRDHSSEDERIHAEDRDV